MANAMEDIGLAEGYPSSEEQSGSNDGVVKFGGNPSEAPTPLGPGLAIDYAESSPDEEDFGPVYENDEPDSMSLPQPPMDTEGMGCVSSNEYDENFTITKPLHSSAHSPDIDFEREQQQELGHSSDHFLHSRPDPAAPTSTNKQSTEGSSSQMDPLADPDTCDVGNVVSNKNNMMRLPYANENKNSSLEPSAIHDAELDEYAGDHHDGNNTQSKLNLPIPPLRESVLRRLSDALTHGTLTMVNLSHRGLISGDAVIIKSVLLNNPHLSELKLSYNCLGDEGAALISSAICWTNGRGHFEHHGSLSLLDMGFNGVGDDGCESLAARAVARNPVIRTLYLSGNSIGEKGSISLASAILNGSGLTCLHLTVNQAGTMGVLALSSAIAENEGRRRAQLLSSSTHGLDLSEVAISPEFNSAFTSIEELYLGGTSMGARGCLSISNMLLTNLSLRVLCLAANGINDRDLALFSQAISRNRNVPLEVIQLSFNRLTCVGVESLMNAIWGSVTLREVRLDNNQIRDRGAQLAAVVLTSVRLETLDLGFNQITTVGIRALMKSLIENDSLRSLTLSGTAFDVNASKAVSFALAHNQSLQALHIDNCSVGYSAQRHIAAGIVSNSNPSLRVVTGFSLGAIAVTMGLPKALENWPNDQALKFFRRMWERRRSEQAEGRPGSVEVGEEAEPGVNGENGTRRQPQNGPSDRGTVILAANDLFSTLNDGAAPWASHSSQTDLNEGSPIVPNDSIMLERTESGTIRVPPVTFDEDISMSDAVLNCANPQGSFAPSQLDAPMDPSQRKRNSDWLKNHIGTLHELAQLPFNDADLWQLHQYFFSPLDLPVVFYDSPDATFSSELPRDASIARTDGTEVAPAVEQKVESIESSTKSSGTTSIPVIARKESYRLLNDVAASRTSSASTGISEAHRDSTSRRRTLSVMDDSTSDSIDTQPASKRARNNKPRIEYYPRIQEKLGRLRANVNQHQVLVLLRQLKYVEGVLCDGRDLYDDSGGTDDSNKLSTVDVEAILDML